MPTEYIDEDHVATGSELVFPNVQSCAAVIAVFNGTMITGGFHLTQSTTPAQVTVLCQHITNTLGASASQVYVIGDVVRSNARGIGGGSTLFNALRTDLGFSGQVRYRQSSASEMRGLAVQLRRNVQLSFVEILVAVPGEWSAGADLMPSDRLYYVRTNNTLIQGTRFGRVPVKSATLNGSVNPIALGSLEIG